MKRILYDMGLLALVRWLLQRAFKFEPLFGLESKLNTFDLSLCTTFSILSLLEHFQAWQEAVYGMLTLLTNIKSSKVLWKNGHHPIVTFSTVGLLEQFQAWQEAEIQYVDFTDKCKIIKVVMVGQSPSMRASPSKYNLFYST